MTEAVQRWLKWEPGEVAKNRARPQKRTDKTDKTPSEASFVSFVSSSEGACPDISPPDVDGRDAVAQPLASSTREALESVLKGTAIALFSDLLGERFWIVADEDDAAVLVGQGEKRGSIYTADEVRAVAVIEDPQVAREVHQLKRLFDTGRLGRERIE
jgi:hypothetical protein